MKKFFPFALVTLLAFLLAACLRINVGTDVIVGSGPMVTRDFEAEGFYSINITGSYVLVWRESSDVSVTITAQENILENLNITVRDQALRIDSHRGISVTSGNTPRLYIYAPYLTGISVNGAVTASGWDTVRVQDFSVDVNGAANLTLDFDVESMDISISGTANINFTGNVSSAVVRLSGAGSVNIAVTDYLDVELSGAGSVRYTGNPTVTSRISGLGTVRRAD